MFGADGHSGVRRPDYLLVGIWISRSGRRARSSRRERALCETVHEVRLSCDRVIEYKFTPRPFFRVVAFRPDRLADGCRPAPLRGDRIPRRWRNRDMPRKIDRLRLLAFERQQGRCHYCQQIMWLGEPGAFVRKHGCGARAAQQRRCTAEHLVARQDGGKDTAENVVAACRFCNATRHRRRRPLPAPAYRKLVRRRMRQGHWFQLEAPGMGSRATRDCGRI